MLKENSSFEKLLMTDEERKADAIRVFTDNILMEVERKIKEVGKEEYLKSLE